MNTNLKSAQAPPSAPMGPIPGEIRDAIDDFFISHPDPAEVDMLLWRMFYHATMYDQNKNGAVGFLEDYGDLHGSLKKLLSRLRPLGAQVVASNPP
ncbi:hypothetical protein [Dyadobacter sp. 676]|uniref:Uncharacterized protein n=1 Tax=Dyadobacter sp. 676 TaxID=3088362 RepID=A0AAU8FGU1_9BACT